MGKHGYNHGDIGWCQLNTTDADAAVKFYTELSGWERHEGPFPDYHVIGSVSEMLGGITGLQEGAAGPNWLPYVTVENLDAAIAKIESLGATVVGDKMDVPEGGKYVVFRDPLGGHTAAIQYGNKPDE